MVLGLGESSAGTNSWLKCVEGAPAELVGPCICLKLKAEAPSAGF
jgi:hypothetical protein